jgi:hypothetical protein
MDRKAKLSRIDRIGVFNRGDAGQRLIVISVERPRRVNVALHNGKEATITSLSAGDVVGEESLAAIVGSHIATATCIQVRKSLPDAVLLDQLADHNAQKLDISLR